ncbi:MAG: alpha/beta hydrolase [Chloroflexi bacterium]|nr:MAG: alpha/beta hydrolase [Chloroflexota bacterium]
MIHAVSNRHARAFVAAVAVVALALLAPIQVLAATPAVPGPALAWTDCQGGFQCATAAVPLDYARPRAGTISLALIRLPATDQAHRIGSLFTNPGGPGASGVEFVRADAAAFPAAIRARFDIVGFDPRGVGASAPVRCFDSVASQQAFFGQFGQFPVGAAQVAAYRQAYQQFDEQCAQRNAAIMAHVSTANVARDIDLLRRAVGDATLSYFGLSYGTYLGATYANLFPNRFRALVLDGVVDPIEYSTGRGDEARELPAFLRLGSDVATQQTLQSFLRQCAAAGPSGCALAAGSAADPTAKLDTLLSRVQQQPIVIQTPQGPRVVTYALLVESVWQSLDVSPGWPALASTLELLFQLSSGVPPAQAIPAPAGTVSIAGLGADAAYQNPREALFANNCVDTSNPGNPLAYPAIAQEASERSPLFGSLWTYVSAPCAGWAARDAGRFDGPWNRHTARPILLVGTTTDPTTPYHDAVSTSHELADARLLTLDGSGHTAFLQGSTCIDRAESAYLISGTLPDRGTTCTPDAPPFGAK